MQTYNVKDIDYRALYPDGACWVFGDFAARIDSSYGENIRPLKEWKTNFEKDVFQTIKTKETEIIDIYKSDPDKALQVLTDLSNSIAEKALTETKKRLENKIASR